tara:strand:- start:3166 stop:3555 length:390 start_codon:yes stop_codon:yes gene_type:complete
MVFEPFLAFDLMGGVVTGGATHAGRLSFGGIMTGHAGLFGMCVFEFKSGFGVVFEIEKLKITFVAKMAFGAIASVLGVEILMNVFVTITTSLRPLFHFEQLNGLVTHGTADLFMAPYQLKIRDGPVIEF